MPRIEAAEVTIEEARKRLSRAEEDLAAIEVLWKRLRFLAVVLVLVIPAHHYFGVRGIIYALVVFAITILPAYYIGYVRLWEFRRTVKSQRDQVRQLEGKI